MIFLNNVFTLQFSCGLLSLHFLTADDLSSRGEQGQRESGAAFLGFSGDLCENSFICVPGTE